MKVIEDGNSKLKFSKANVKLARLYKTPQLRRFLTGKRKVYSLDLLAGHSCPNAKDCLSKVVDGKIKDGKHTQFRCYAASLEVIFRKTFDTHKYNFELLQKLDYTDLVKLISKSLPQNLGICRIHSSGDFFSEKYFLAWLEVARQNPDKLFYAYTKSLSYWVRSLNTIPSNMILTASYGGRLDNLIEEKNLRFARVVYSPQEAKKLGLTIDHTDEKAANPASSQKPFALLLHGIQPAKSEAQTAIQNMKKKNIQFSYSI